LAIWPSEIDPPFNKNMADLYVDSAPLTRPLTIILNSFTAQKSIFAIKTFNDVASTASLGRDLDRFTAI